MGDMLACLRGWHPALARAELVALLPEANVSPTPSSRWWTVQQTTADERSEALAVASGLQCFLQAGIVSPVSQEGYDSWLETMRAYLSNHPVEGTVAVRSWKQGEKIPHWGPTTLAKRLGRVLHDMGYSINLDQPDHVMAIITDASTASLACGWMEGDGLAAFSNGERRAGERPFFKPVSLDPMLARLAVNLAAGPVANGPVIDPMTGTGGFLIEASLSGRPCLGIDIHSEMVHGAKANLQWAHGDAVPANAQVKRGDATRLGDATPENWKGHVAGFVLDPPYGRNSHGSVNADSLLEGCLRSAREVAAHHAGFVLILPIHPMDPHPETALPMGDEPPLYNRDWPSLRCLIEQTGWTLVSMHVERVHRSLSRLILHARCAPRD